MAFLERIRKETTPTILVLNSTLNFHIKSLKKEMGKKEGEKLSLDEIFEIFDIIKNDPKY
jgi:hypothetical protein